MKIIKELMTILDKREEELKYIQTLAYPLEDRELFLKYRIQLIIQQIKIKAKEL